MWQSQYVEAVGGKLHGFWYAFGDPDAYSLLETPERFDRSHGLANQRRGSAELLPDDCLTDR